MNVPLNDAIKAAGNPSVIDTRSVRAAFHARRWEVANLVRTVLTIGGFVLLAISLRAND